MHAGVEWRYAPRPGARPVRSIAAPPSGRRTNRIRACLPDSSRQATHVRAGSWRDFAIAVLVGLARLDVDPEPRELGGKPRVLTVSPDGQGKLAARHEHRGCSRDAVDHHPVGFGRTERRGDECFRILGPRDDVDVLVRKLAEDRAVPDALWSDAGPNRVEPGLRGRDGDLGSQTRLACDPAHEHSAGLDLRHLRLEQALDEAARSARDANLRLARVALRFEDHDERRATWVQLLPGNLFLRRHDAFGPAEVDVNGAALYSVHDARGELALVLRHVSQHLVALEVVNVAQDSVLGGLGGKTLEILGGQLAHRLDPAAIPHAGFHA